MSREILGIDIGKKQYQATLRIGEKKMRRTFGNRAEEFDSLSKWLSKHRVQQVHVCLEATGSLWQALALYLDEQGYAVSVVNPARIHAYGQSKLRRNKTDKLDADLIADFCATQQPGLWKPAPVEIRQLQALVERRDELVTMRTQEQNRLSSGSHAVVEPWIEQHVSYLTQQIGVCEAEIQAHIQRHAGLRAEYELLLSIPAIGPHTAAKLLAAHIRSFRSTRALAAYAGLNPRSHESGTSVHRRARLSKIGPPSLRQALYMPALVAKRVNPVVSALCERLAARHKPPMVQVGAAMRKLLCLALGVLKSGRPFDPHFVSQPALAA